MLRKGTGKGGFFHAVLIISHKQSEKQVFKVGKVQYAPVLFGGKITLIKFCQDIAKTAYRRIYGFAVTAVSLGAYAENGQQGLLKGTVDTLKAVLYSHAVFVRYRYFLACRFPVWVLIEGLYVL